MPPAESRELSRQLHDEVAHSVAVGLQCLELSEHHASRGDPDRARSKQGDATRILRRALQTTRELAARLRVRSEDDRTRVADQGSLTVLLPLPRSAHPDPAELYAILREAVDNALRHSGADDIAIHIRTGGGAVAAVVEDNGAGVDQEADGRSTALGLQSMRERAILLGGSFSLGRARAGGVRVTVVLPLEGPP
jgi:signal transduction histidine kinase